ncbi:MAG TPA: prenyltransferase/squalene oxidase repeat-containing protein [Acidimicrobiales bacterium]
MSRPVLSRLGAGFVSLVAAATALLPSPVGALVDEGDRAAAARGVAWTATQQRPNGGFEVAGGLLNETMEAALAFAANAQTTLSWSPRQAVAGVQAVSTDKGVTALDFLDDLADATGPNRMSPGTAAKMIALVVAPLCLDATQFDPQADGGTNLVARLQEAAGSDGSYAAPFELNVTLYAVLALESLGMPVPDAAIEEIKGAQKADGSYHYSGEKNPEFDYDDYDTTSLAIQALVSAGVGFDDRSIAGALEFYAERHAADGSWDFGNTNSVANAILALRAARFDPDGRAWRDLHAPARSDDAYVSPKDWLQAQQQADGRFASPFDEFGVNTFATTQSVRALLERFVPVTFASGTCDGRGYRLFAADGGVFTYGTAAFHGSAGALPLKSPIVGGWTTPLDKGTYLVAADGGVFTYGDALFRGSLGGGRINSPVVGGAPSVSGLGYYLFAADGGVFTFGDAVFRGSMGGTPLNQPIVAGALSPTGGYVLIAKDGGVFTFGGARYEGSLGGTPLNKPVVAAAITPTGRGYVLVATDGGVFTFGDARFAGSTGGTRINSPIVGVLLTPTARGYILTAADGGVFTFGNARFAGSAAGSRINSPIVAGTFA